MNIAKRILALVGLYATTAVGGRSTRITCRRLAPDRIDCSSRSAPLGIPWGSETAYPGVQGATVRDDEGLGRKFVLELEMAEGPVALDGEMTVDERQTAQEINAFLHDPRQETLVVSHVDWAGLAGTFFFVGGLAGIYPGLA